MAIFNYFLSFVITFTIIVFIHEFGHYFVARIFKVKIEEFSIGFGKILYSITDKLGTKWQVRLLPVGGYVKMLGDMNAASVADNDKLKSLSKAEQKQTFTLKPVWQKFLIVFAGPAINILFAILIITFITTIRGEPKVTNYINYIKNASPADQAGMLVKDKVYAINNKQVNSPEEIINIVRVNAEQQLVFTVERNKELLDLYITPELKIINEQRIGVIGIKFNIDYHKIGWQYAANHLVNSIGSIFQFAKLFYNSLWQMLIGKQDTKELGGFVRIAEYSKQSMESGLINYLFFLAIFSVNIGLLNLLPIPLLDGGHLVFYLYEMVFGKTVSLKYQNLAYRVGFSIIIFLFVFSSINDIKHYLLN